MISRPGALAIGPLHYRAKADNARFAAYLLSQLSPADWLPAAAAEVGYHGTAAIALKEAFSREAALALELIVKAVIALKIERGTAPKHVDRVRPIHDVPKLLVDAELPPPSNNDQLRLLIVKQLLIWSSRYAAPKKDTDTLRDIKDVDAFFPPGLHVRRYPPLDWQNFDRLYQIAFSGLRGVP